MFKKGDLVCLKSNKEIKMVICDNELTGRWINKEGKVKTNMDLTEKMIEVVQKHETNLNLNVGDIVFHKSNIDFNLSVVEISDEVSCSWIIDEKIITEEFELEELIK